MSSSPAQQPVLLSIADIARHFDLPESTTRYYCKRFAAHIPSTGEGRRRRYRSETLEVIAVILDEMRKSRTAAEVEERLSASFPRNAELSVAPEAPFPASDALPTTPLPASRPCDDTRRGAPLSDASPAVLQLLERQTCALEGMLQVFRLLAERLPLPGSQAAPPAGDQDALQKEVRTLRTLLEACEKNQQADMEQIRRWIGKTLRDRQQP